MVLVSVLVEVLVMVLDVVTVVEKVKVVLLVTGRCQQVI